MIELYFEDDQPPIPCASVEALARAIDELHEHYLPLQPICAVINFDKLEIDFGLGDPEGFVYVQVAPFDGEYYQSAGDPTADEYIDFFGCGGHTPFERSPCVPFAAVKQAVIHFVAEQSLSPAITWQDWDERVVAGQPWLRS